MIGAFKRGPVSNDENPSHFVCSCHDLPLSVRRHSGCHEYSRTGPKAPVRGCPDSSRRSIPHLGYFRTKRIFRRTLAGLGSCSWKPQPHGSKLMTMFGSYYRLYFASAGLLHPAGCEDAGHVYIRADIGSRTQETGRALATGMMPGCDVDVQSVSSAEDPLFSPLSGFAKPDGALAAASISGRIGANPSALVGVYRQAFGTLREVLFGCAPATPCPPEEKPGKRSVLEQPSSVEESKGDHAADLRGPLRIGSTLSEDFLLEYVNGMEGKDLGWGRLDAG